MSFPRYDSYRESGVEWLGEIPRHWATKRVKDITTLVNGFPFDSKNFTSEAGKPLLRIRDLNATETETCYVGEFEENYLVTADELLIGMDGDFNVGRWMGAEPALLNQRVCALRTPSYLISRLLEHILPIPLKRINDLTYSTTVKHLSSFQVEQIRVALPPEKGELHTLLNFLDRETSKIDALVEEQGRLIELLKEKRQAVISHAVSKGLNPGAPMKDSGVEWLGEVPTHWNVVRIKHIARMESGHTPDRKIAAYWEECDIPWVSLHDTAYLKDNDYISETAQQINSLGIENSSARLLPPGVVVFSRDATIGRCAITTREMAVSQHFIAWVCSEQVSPEFLLLCLRSMTGELERLTSGATLKTIGMPDVRTLTVALPELTEQTAIVNCARRGTEQIDSLIAEAEIAVGLLRERRSALISAAVTGKIDVRKLGGNQAEAA